jgi:hypothetical protein
MHPVPRRCSSVKYSRYCTPPCTNRTVGAPHRPSSRLAGRAPRRPRCITVFMNRTTQLSRLAHSRASCHGPDVYWNVVRVRCVALVLLLTVAVVPVIGVVCELDCDKAGARSACHGAAAGETAVLRGNVHGCGHGHLAGAPALLARASSRAHEVWPDALPLLFVPTVSPAPELPAALTLHGPPGLDSRNTNAIPTVLRI